jgi:branched-chain amino acid transport system substrate-binding protein
VLEKAGSTEPKAIQKAANAIEIPGKKLVVPWERASSSPPRATKWARTFWDPASSASTRNGQKDGKIGLEIVYPFDVASADMIYPFKGF